MGRGNVCVFGEYEGLYYVDNDYLHEYKRVDEETGETELRLLGELSYDELTDGEWKYSSCYSEVNYISLKLNLRKDIKKRFPSFIECSEWIEHDREAIMQNDLFYIALADNQWSIAVMLVQKEHWCYDYTGLQKKHYQRYLDGIRDALFEQFDEIGVYGGAWTHGTIKREDYVSLSA